MKALLLKLICFYKRRISPTLPPCCRFTPTCSEYALEAISLYGAFRGGLMALWRIVRCNPFSKGGFDPVPKPSISNPNPDIKADPKFKPENEYEDKEKETDED